MLKMCIRAAPCETRLGNTTCCGTQRVHNLKIQLYLQVQQPGVLGNCSYAQTCIVAACAEQILLVYNEHEVSFVIDAECVSTKECRGEPTNCGHIVIIFPYCATHRLFTKHIDVDISGLQAA